VYVESWLTPFALGTGVLALAMFAFLAAVYLTVEASDDELRRDFKRRALAAAGVTAGVAVLLPFLPGGHDALMRERLLGSPWSMPLLFTTVSMAALAIRSLVRERYRLARVAAAGVVTLVIAGWAVAQFPFVVPPDLTIELAAAPRSTQRLVALVLGLGAVVLLPSLAYLFRVFKVQQLGNGTAGEGETEF
jgi:cytochrome d ubiquinol oxidase subunit II